MIFLLTYCIYEVNRTFKIKLKWLSETVLNSNGQGEKWALKTESLHAFIIE